MSSALEQAQDARAADASVEPEFCHVGWWDSEFAFCGHKFVAGPEAEHPADCPVLGDVCMGCGLAVCKTCQVLDAVVA